MNCEETWLPKTNGIKSGYLTIRPLWSCVLVNKSILSHLRVGFVLGKCVRSMRSIGKYFIKSMDFKISFGYLGCHEYQWKLEISWISWISTSLSFSLCNNAQKLEISWISWISISLSFILCNNAQLHNFC